MDLVKTFSFNFKLLELHKSSEPKLYINFIGIKIINFTKYFWYCHLSME